MTKATKQQEFLEILKDPTGTKLLKVVEEFQDDHPFLINSIRIEQISNDEYAIHVETDIIETIYVLEKKFTNAICNRIKGLMINVTGTVLEFNNGTFVKTYYASNRITGRIS